MFRRMSIGTVCSNSGRCAPKISANSAIDSMRQNVWVYEIIHNRTSQNVNWEPLLMSELNCTMCLLWKLVCRCFITLPKEPPAIFFAGWKSSRLAACTGIASVLGGSVTLSWATELRQLIVDDCWYSDSSLYFSVGMHFPTSTLRALLRLPRSAIEGRMVPDSLMQWSAAWNVRVRAHQGN